MKMRTNHLLRISNLFVLVSTICLMAISLLAKWHYITALSRLLSFLPLALFFLPIENSGKDIVAMFVKPAPVVCLFFTLLLSSNSDRDICGNGVCLQLFALGFACMVFNSKNKGIAHLVLCVIYTVLSSLILSSHTNLAYLPFCESATACITLSIASWTGWFGKEYRWLYAVVSLFCVWWNAYDAKAQNCDYLIDQFCSPFYGSHGSAVMNSYLHNMRFVGKTTTLDLSNVLNYRNHDTCLFFFAGAEYGLISFIVIGILLSLLVIGLILLAKKRKGVGRFFPALCAWFCCYSPCIILLG